MPNYSYLLALILSSLAIVPLVAQNAASDAAPAAPTFRMTARSVVVDVIVTDKAGHAVTGLPKEQFQIFEDGKPQAITSFEEHSGIPAVAAGASAMNPAPLPANTSSSDTFTNVPAVPPADSINLLLMDALNTPIANQAFVHKQMVQYLATIPPGTRMGVFTLSERLRMLQGITADTSALRAAIARSAANPNQSGLLPTAQESAVNQEAVGAIRSTGPQSTTQDAEAAALQEFLNQQAQFAVNQRVIYTLDAFQQLARYLAGVPGRKNLIWFSDSFPLCQLKDTNCPYKQQMDETMDMLAKAQISVYPISASGLAADAINDASAPPNHSLDANLGRGVSPSQVATQIQVRSLSAGSAERNDTRDTMESFAKDTGGAAIYNTNDLRSALERDIINGARYYTVSYTPPQDSVSGKMHSIKVQLIRGKYKLAYRRYYFGQTSKALKAEATAPAGDPLHPMMVHGMPDFTELPYRMRIVPVAPQASGDAPRVGENTALAGPTTRYRINFMLGIDGLELDHAPDGNRNGSIEVALVAYSRDGKPRNWDVRKIALTLTPQQFDSVQHSGIPFQLELDIPRGDVFLRTGILDLSSQRVGTIEIPISAITAHEVAIVEASPSLPASVNTSASTDVREPAEPNAQPAESSPDVNSSRPVIPTEPSSLAPIQPHKQKSSVIFWSLASKQVDTMLASPPHGSDARYARLRSYFTQLGCTGTRMEEESVTKHTDHNLVCSLPGTEAGEIVVTAHYERRENEDASTESWRGAVMLAMLYNALQAEPRRHTYVFAELCDDDGEKQFLTGLLSERNPSPVAAVALDLPAPGPLQYKLSWNGYLMAWAQPGSDPASQSSSQDTVSPDMVRIKALRSGEETKAVLASTLVRSTQMNGIPQPLDLKLSRTVKNAQLFRHGTDIPSILIYTVAPLRDPNRAPQTSGTSGRAAIFDLLAAYLCGLDSNLTTPSNSAAR